MLKWAGMGIDFLKGRHWLVRAALIGPAFLWIPFSFIVALPVILPCLVWTLVSDVWNETR